MYIPLSLNFTRLLKLGSSSKLLAKKGSSDEDDKLLKMVTGKIKMSKVVKQE